MSKLIRKQLYITREQDNRLKIRAKKMGVTQAELVREAIDNQSYTVEYPNRDLSKWQEEVEFIKSRMLHKEYLRGERTWKREDLYDR